MNIMSTRDESATRGFVFVCITRADGGRGKDGFCAKMEISWANIYYHLSKVLVRVIPCRDFQQKQFDVYIIHSPALCTYTLYIEVTV
jgi:hypothetical protein